MGARINLSTHRRQIIGKVGRKRNVGSTVCGNYGECSPDVHELLAITADGLAERRWRLMGARSMTEARAFFIARLRRSLSVIVAREMARHRLRRIPFIGVPRSGCERCGSLWCLVPVSVRRSVWF